MGVGYARQSLKEEIPRFKTLSEWDERKSTKFDICARMCQHLLSCDDAPEMVLANGTVSFPEIPNPQLGKVALRTTKILIYQEFPCLGPLLRNVSFFLVSSQSLRNLSRLNHIGLESLGH